MPKSNLNALFGIMRESEIIQILHSNKAGSLKQRKGKLKGYGFHSVVFLDDFAPFIPFGKLTIKTF